MASKRNKKYTMRAISPKFSEKGSFTAAKGAAATINGKYLQLIDGDTVTAKCGNDERTLEVVELAAFRAPGVHIGQDARYPHFG